MSSITHRTDGDRHIEGGHIEGGHIGGGHIEGGHIEGGHIGGEDIEGEDIEGEDIEGRGASPLQGRAREGESPGSEPFDGEALVNYEEAPVLELELDGTDYRLDVGRAGTALCISTRPGGSWSWVFRGEARFVAGVLRCKAFDRSVLSQLSTALSEAAASSQS